ncbi:hypothetical protein D3C81_1682770 [compost metagenome]
MLLLAHQVNGLLARGLHAGDEFVHQALGVTFALVHRVHHHRHDHHVRCCRVMADQFLEVFIRHDDFVGATAIDEANDLTCVFQDQEALRILRDAGADLLQRGRFIPFIGADFNGVAALGVCNSGGAELRGIHG